MRKVILATVLALTTLPVTARAEITNDVQEMLGYCEEEKGSNFLSGLCLGRLQGITTVMNYNCQNGGPPHLSANTDGVSFGAFQQAFLNWARDNPQQWSIPWSHGLMVSIGETFPCKG